MRLLALADEECPALWDYYTPEKLQGIDLMIACGDLCAEYLEFLVTMGRVPLFYVHGNHDGAFDEKPPEGVQCLDDTVIEYKGLRIAGLGGSYRYRQGPWQFTEAEMKKRVRRLRPRIDRAGGLDVLVTHAPPHGYGDLPDTAHHGFTAFDELLEAYRPQLVLHGHIHLRYAPTMPREHQFGRTRIINAYERVTVDLPDPPPRAARPLHLLEHWRLHKN